MNSATEKNPNANHRKRLRDKFISGGAEALAPHELIELILFYSIKRKNTNSMAHDLIDKFGSVSAVLEADIKDLETVNGIGEESALLINLFSQVFRIYRQDKISLLENKAVNNTETAADIIKTLFYGLKNEVFYVINMSPQLKIISCEKISEGTERETAVYIKKIVKSALRCNASSVILAHNHPGGTLNPSASDMDATRKAFAALKMLDINLNDHIIVVNDSYFSFRKQNLL